MAKKSVVARLMAKTTHVVPGSYDAKTQTWSHRNQSKFSPVKHNREA